MIDLVKKIFAIIDRKDRVRLFFILVAMVFSAAFDLIGVSSIVPIMSLLSTDAPNGIITPENVGNYNFVVQLLFRLFGVNSVDKLTIISLALFSAFLLFKTCYAFFISFITNKFSLNLSRKLIAKQMDTFLHMPYEYHLNNNSSALIRKCTYDVTSFTGALNCLLDLGVKGITAIAIVVYLAVFDYRITLIVGGALALFSLFVVFVLKPRIKSTSKETQRLNSYNYKYISQAFSGIKESKISNTEDFFAKAYNDNIRDIHNYQLKKEIFSIAPHHLVELVGMVGLCGALIVIIVLKDDIGQTNAGIIEVFSVFAYAVIKLLPCISAVNSQINLMSWHKISVDSIYNDIEEGKKIISEKQDNSPEQKPLPFENEIALNNLTFAYSLAPEKKILNKVSCVIKKNTSVAFSGVSGAGKTTIIDNILGLLNPQEGCVTCDGVDIRTNMKGWRSNVSYIPQSIYLTDDTIRNNVAFGIKEREISDQAIWDALEKAQLKDFVKSLPDQLDTVVGEAGVRLSGGQRQRIGIARAFYRDTNIIVFDEATSALDFETEKNILNHVEQYAGNHTLIIITHRMNTIEHCDHIYKVDSGNLLTIK